MASEPRDRSAMTELPDSLAEWLAERAEITNVSQDELLAELVAAYRVAVEDGEVDGEALAGAMGLNDRVTERQSDIRSELNDRLDALDERHQSALDDVRKRVVQLKQITEQKANTDHEHDELDRVATLAETVEQLESSLGELESAVEYHDEELQGVEGDLSDLREKLTQVARAVVQLQSPDDGAGNEPGPLVDLKREAARMGIDHASCGGCEAEVDISLLGEAVCPHCGTAFEGLRDASGSLDEPRLTGQDDDMKD